MKEWIFLALCSISLRSGNCENPPWFKNITTNLFRSPGDILIGGLFPISQLTSDLSKREKPDDVECNSISKFGLSMSLMMKFTVDEINSKDNLLPGISLGFENYDTCMQPAVVMKPTLQLLTKELTDELEVTCDYTNYKPRVMAIIGPYSSELVKVIGKLTGFFLMPQISFGATSDVFSDKEVFPSFMRTLPTDRWQAEAMVEILKEFGWNWVSVIGSDEEYGQQGLQLFSNIASENNICVAYQGLIPVYGDPGAALKEILYQIENAKVGVVVIIAITDQVKNFFKEVIKHNLTAVWVASTAWSLVEDIYTLPGISSVGTVLAFSDITRPLKLFTPYIWELLTKMEEAPPDLQQVNIDGATLDNTCPICNYMTRANASMAPLSTCSSDCGVGQVRRVKGFHSCCFDCIDCMPGTFLNNSDDIQCKQCPIGQWSSSRSTRCIHPIYTYLYWTNFESLSLIFAGGLVLVCYLCVAGLFLKHRETPLVKTAGGPLCALTLSSLAAECVSLLLFLGQPGDIVCRMQQPLNAIFPSMALSAILILALQVVCVTEFPEKSRKHLENLRGRVEPMLNFGLMIGFNVILALISFMSTFMALKPHGQYNLPRDITTSTLCYCVVWVLFIPIYTSLNDKDKSVAQLTFVIMPRGRPANSALSDSSDLDYDGAAETELEKLQRQFRITEGDRQAYSIQSQEIIRKQRHEISKLHEEQEELLRTLHVLESQSRRQSESQETESVQFLLEQGNIQHDQLERERQIQAQLELEITNLEKRLLEARKEEISTSHSHVTQARHTQKAIRTLENKLDRALIRFNEQLTKNSQLREELEILRMQRVRFQQLRSKLEKVLQDVRKDIGEVIDMSTTAYEARVEAQTKITMMKDKEMKDFSQHSANIKELERVIAHEHRLKEFMTTKSSERTALDEGQEISRRQEKTYETLEEVFQQIQRVAGEDNLEMLVTKFIRVEDRNFALFNYVNEQNAEADQLRGEIHQIKEEIEQLHMKDLQQEQDHQALLKQLKDQQLECTAQVQDYEAQADDISKILDQIKAGIDSVFVKIECERGLLDNMLGSSSGIMDRNIMTYLSLVEQRTSLLLTIQAFIKSKDMEKKYDLKQVAQFLLGQKPDVQKQATPVQPPVARHDYEAEDPSFTDEEDRPLTHQELHLHILKTVASKDEPQQAGGSKYVKIPKSSSLSVSREHSLDV
ncbi:hypothetical protein DNTS_031477 [Danionella cerebrum]|uniref:G-protein coupled receptors family 3 profile domain-containing protein n=1 Tax=Danionella cerebrum TaxID=2873325 RepID=A0A553PEP4_9TELE|nr:hypothetical protein DNTS_031477 [Danionella translucida]